MGVKPWLKELLLDWHDVDDGESVFLIAAHADLLSDTDPAHRAVDIAVADVALLSCCLTLERRVVSFEALNPGPSI